MGKSCSKQGNLEIDYDIMTSRTEPEGQCLTPVANSTELTAHDCWRDSEGASSLQGQEEQETAFCKVIKLKENSAFNIDSLKHDGVFETDVVVELPPESCDAAKGMPFKKQNIIKHSEVETPKEVLEGTNHSDLTEDVEPSGNGEASEAVQALPSSSSFDHEKWSYTLYDFEGRGRVDSNDFTQLVQSLCTVVGHSIGKDVFKLDKENVTKKLRKDDTGPSKRNTKCGPRVKTGSKDLTKTCIPPPESEEAEKLSSYIEEKLKMSSRQKGQKSFNTQNVRRPFTGIRNSDVSGCGCNKNNDKNLSAKHSPSRRRYGANQSSFNRGDRVSLVAKDRKNPSAKRHDIRVGKYQQRPYGTDTNEVNASSLQADLSGKCNLRRIIPKRQETYPGACSDSESEIVVSRCQDVGASFQCTNARHILGRASVRSKDHCSMDENSEANSPCINGCKGVSEVEPGRHCDNWPEVRESNFRNDVAMSRLKRDQRAQESYRHLHDPICHMEHSNGSGGLFCDHKHTITNENCGRNMSHNKKHVKLVKSLSDCGSSFTATNDTASSYVASLSEKVLSSTTETTSLQCSPSAHAELRTGEYYDKSRYPEIGDCDHGSSRSGRIMHNASPRKENTRRRCPCHCRTSNSKDVSISRCTFTPETTETADNYLHITERPERHVSHTVSHTNSTTTSPSHMSSERLTKSVDESLRVEHVCRHEHYHYHYYIDKHK